MMVITSSSLGELTPDETAFLLSLDPSEWKKQDHYRVLGLENIRSKSTDDDIKRAYRKKVLQHHPDKKDKTKKSRLPPGVNEHGYFTCITKVRLEGKFSWAVAPDGGMENISPLKSLFSCIFLLFFYVKTTRLLDFHLKFS